MHYLSGCLVIRNEALYIEEWLDFHLKQGWEHFYIYDNESTDNTKKLLTPYIDDGLITWHNTYGLQQQQVAYNHSINAYKDETIWMSYTDCDEFTWSTKDKVFVETLSRDYDRLDISGVAIHWLLFGSGGALEYENKPVLERFTMRAKEPNKHVKSIMKLNETERINNNPHCFIAYGNVVDEYLNVLPLQYAIRDNPTADILRINHYYCKSKEEHRKRKSLPCASSGGMKDHEIQFAAHDHNDTEDLKLRDFFK